MDCNFKQETEEEFFKRYNDKANASADAWKIRNASKEPKISKSKKKEWEKNFNKTWNKLSVGQQMAIVSAVDGEENIKYKFRPTIHVSNLDSKGNRMFNDKGQPLKREWQTYEPKGALGLGINKRREYYDYMIKKYNFPKLDRVVGAKLG